MSHKVKIHLPQAIYDTHLVNREGMPTPFSRGGSTKSPRVCLIANLDQALDIVGILQEHAHREDTGVAWHTFEMAEIAVRSAVF